jgi:hypothetical protein
MVGTQVAGSGLGNEYDSDRTFHSYYQWVPFTLFFQVRLIFNMISSNTWINFTFVVGSHVLRPSLDLEELGGRQNANDLRRSSRSSYDADSRETYASRPIGPISRRQYEHSQHLRVRILFLRIFERSQCGKLTLK